VSIQRPPSAVRETTSDEIAIAAAAAVAAATAAWTTTVEYGPIDHNCGTHDAAADRLRPGINL